MKINCPNCDASYRIDVRSLGAGRTVRCARCRTEWFAGDGTTPVEIAEPMAPELAAIESLEPIESLDDAFAIDAIEGDHPNATAKEARRPPRPSVMKAAFGRLRPSAGKARGAPDRPRRKSPFKLRPSAAFATVGCVLLAVMVGERVQVVRAAPSLASLYDRVGLPVNVRGLSISDVRSVERIEDGVPLLLVSGVVKNVSGDVVEVPRLKLAITAGRDRELYAWTTVAARAKLAPGESASFRARLASPPADGQGLAVRFVGQTDLARASH